VTTRILVVDLLSKRLSAAEVAGAVVMNAHRVTDTSGEGFAVRLLRAGNGAAFVRALSDQPTSFGGFSKVGTARSQHPHSQTPALEVVELGNTQIVGRIQRPGNLMKCSTL